MLHQRICGPGQSVPMHMYTVCFSCYKYTKLMKTDTTGSSAEDTVNKKILFFLWKAEKEKVPRSCNTVTFQNQKAFQIRWILKSGKNFRNTYKLELSTHLLRLQLCFEEICRLHLQIIRLFYSLLNFFFGYKLIQKSFYSTFLEENVAKGVLSWRQAVGIHGKFFHC